MANPAEERERERIRSFVQKDLGKEIEDLVTDVHQESLTDKHFPVPPITRTLARFASLLGALYIKADIQTRRIVRLTWALVFLTVALLIFTGYLSYDAYLNHQRAKQERKDRTEKREPDVNIHKFMPPSSTPSFPGK